MIESQLNRIGDRDDRHFADRIFKRHYGVSKYLQRAYVREADRARKAGQQGHASANRLIRVADDVLRLPVGITASADDQALRDLAAVRATQAKGVKKEYAARSDVDKLRERLTWFCRSCGVQFPLKVTKSDTASDIAGKIISAAERVSDERWWRRQLRVMAGRTTEGVLRGLGYVQASKAPYVSNWAMARWQASQERNRKTLAQFEAVTKDPLDPTADEVTVNLGDCVQSSMANPENRRHELMVRIRGFEEIAQGLGLVGLFFTLTCPSRYHAQRHRGTLNPSFDGSSPVEAMDHLNKTWSLIRAQWAKKGIKAFGLRVAEPHHDGTPHFHFWLFVNPEEQATACRIFGQYAMAVDGDEPGADRYRWDVMAIDPSKGSAAGYVAKYVAKNLDGYAVGMDEEGECFADDGAMRARAWASLWGIRQFQQIGSVSVTVWRELRRCRDPFESMVPDEVEALRIAADRGDWAEFVELMGGAFVSRKDQTLRPEYVESEGGPVASRYGEGVKRLIGVWLQPVAKALARCVVVTRDRVWTIRECSRSGRDHKAAQPPPSDLCQ